MQNLLETLKYLLSNMGKIFKFDFNCWKTFKCSLKTLKTFFKHEKHLKTLKNIQMFA